MTQKLRDDTAAHLRRCVTLLPRNAVVASPFHVQGTFNLTHDPTTMANVMMINRQLTLKSPTMLMLSMAPAHTGEKIEARLSAKPRNPRASPCPRRIKEEERQLLCYFILDVNLDNTAPA